MWTWCRCIGLGCSRALCGYVKGYTMYKLGSFLTSLSTNSFSAVMMFEYNNDKRLLTSWNCLDINLFYDIYRTSETPSNKKEIAFPFRHLSYYGESFWCLFYRNPFPYVWHYVAIQLEMTSVSPLLQAKSLWCQDVTSHPVGLPLAVTCSFRHIGGGGGLNVVDKSGSDSSTQM